MPTIGSITKTIRINAEDLQVFERLMADGTSWSGAVHQLCSGEKSESVGTPENPEKSLPNGKKMNISDEDYAEFSSMVGFMGGEREFFHSLVGFLSEGSIAFERNEYVIKDLSLSTDEFKEVCKDMGKDPQNVLNEATKRLKRGWL